MKYVTKLLTAATVAVVLIVVAAPLARAGTVPAGFQEKVAFSGLSEPTSLAFSPDGRVFVAQKSGVIKVFDSLADSSPETFANLSNQVYNYWDRGLLGMALDPDFPAEPYIYVLYTLDAVPGGSVPRWGGTSLGDPCPSPPGPTNNGCVATGRLSKLTASGNSMTAETPLITDWCQQFPSHSIGDLAFGADGSLYVSGGEGASFNYADWGQSGDPINPCGDPPAGVGGVMTPPTSEGGSLRSQDVRTLADPTGLDGALLRIDPDTGAGLPTNPFAASSDANARRIISYGYRNPFRFTVDPVDGEIWLGDVGSETWEEINRIDPDAATASNRGWPCYEGNNASSAKLFEWDSSNLGLCESLYAEGAGAVSAPYYAYNHSAKVVGGETCGTGSSSISGLAFYQAGPFPNAYNGALFFADYSRNCIWAMLPGANGKPDKTKIQTFDAGATGPVDLKVGPDGAIYFPSLNSGNIFRISHTVGNQAPVADASATPDNGAAPLDVQLSASGSKDADAGDTLEYAWDLDGDGEFDDSTAIAPTYLYTDAGIHIATVRVSDPDGASDTDSVSIQVNNTPPTATISAPASTLTWAVDDEIAFAGSGVDPEDGALPPSAYLWRLIVHHCPSNCHTHKIESLANVTEGDFVAPDHDYPAWLEIELTVTDAGGLTDTASVSVFPQTVELELQTLPTSGFNLAVNGHSTVSPSTTTVIKGSNNTVAAPTQELNGTEYAFGAWSDGGAASHNVTVADDMTLTAIMGPPSTPAITGVTPASPANQNNPVVRGTVSADHPQYVKLFTNPSCTGSAAASGTPEQFEGGGIPLSVADDTTVSIYAATANTAGNSPCSAAVTYVEDSTAPAAPSLTATSPPSPANDNHPEVIGSLNGGSPTTIDLYANADCSGSPAASGNVATFTAAGITVDVPGDQGTPISARADDAAGNESACSDPLTYVEDSTFPEAPVILSTNPASPANDSSPEVRGDAAAGSTVRIYRSSDCSGAAVTGTAEQFASPGISVTVEDNSVTTLSAQSADAADNVSLCSASTSYAEDSTAPPTPTLAITPSSPANDNSPKVRGSAAADSTVRIYRSAGCSGPVAAIGTPSELAAGLTLTVADDETAELAATAVDSAGNTSPCSAASLYVEDSTPPRPPVLATTFPTSPANDNKPTVLGSAENGSSVRIHTTADCAGPDAAVAAAWELSTGVGVSVPSDRVTPLSASATDVAGNRSPCSTTLDFIEDSTAPQTAITRGPPSRLLTSHKRSGRAARSILIRFGYRADEDSVRFFCQIDAASSRSCATSSLRARFKPGRHTFSVYAVDAAGNREKSPARRSFRVVRPALNSR
jgi:glucose/arabinose dehydrogenase/PKD repeat protein